MKKGVDGWPVVEGTFVNGGLAVEVLQPPSCLRLTLQHSKIINMPAAHCCRTGAARRSIPDPEPSHLPAVVFLKHPITDKSFPKDK